MKLVKAYILLRTSTNLQETEQQLSECQKYAGKHNIQIVGKFETKESAFKNRYTERDDMMTILDMARRKELECLLCYKIDRLAREMGAISFFTTLIENKVAIHSVVEGEIKGETTMDKLNIILRLFQGEQESENTSVRIKDKLKELNERGIYVQGSVPYGFKLLDTGKVRNFAKGTTQKDVLIDENTAPIVTEIFNLYLNHNYGCTKIANMLNNRSIASPKGRKWSSGTVHGILTNRCYMGFLRYNTQSYETASSKQRVMHPKEEYKYKPFPHLRLVSDTDFKRVQEKLVASNVKGIGNKSTHSNTHLFSGLVRCGYCKKKLIASSTSHKRKDGSRGYNFHYICRSLEGLEGHLQKSYGIGIEKHLEARIVADIAKYIEFDTSVLDYLGKNRESNLLAIKKEIATLDEQIAEQNDILEGINMELKLSFIGKSKFNQDLLLRMISETQSSIDTLQNAQKALREEINTSNDLEVTSELRTLLTSWEAIYERATFEQKKVLLSTIVDYIEISKGEATVHYKINQILYAKHRVNNSRMYGEHITFKY